MADDVQRVLEDMVPELRDYEKIGVFSEGEVKDIVKKRRDFEYKLHRRAPQKVDFLRAISFELNLEALRKLRKKRMGIKKSKASDNAIVHRIIVLFTRAVRKFRGDSRLWLQFIDFGLRTNSSRLLTRIMPRVLQLHPRNPTFWILAASWEFDHNNNMKNARVFMQRAIRLNKDYKGLWLHYFKLELLHLLRLRARRQLIGISDADVRASIDPDSAQKKEEEEEVPAEKVAQRAFFRGAIPIIVYNNAIEETPNDLQLRLAFLEETDRMRTKLFHGMTEAKAEDAIGLPDKGYQVLQFEQLKLRTLKEKEAVQGIAVPSVAFPASSAEIVAAATARGDAMAGTPYRLQDELLSSFPAISQYIIKSIAKDFAKDSLAWATLATRGVDELLTTLGASTEAPTPPSSSFATTPTGALDGTAIPDALPSLGGTSTASATDTSAAPSIVDLSPQSGESVFLLDTFGSGEGEGHHASTRKRRTRSFDDSDTVKHSTSNKGWRVSWEKFQRGELHSSLLQRCFPSSTPADAVVAEMQKPATKEQLVLDAVELQAEEALFQAAKALPTQDMFERIGEYIVRQLLLPGLPINEHAQARRTRLLRHLIAMASIAHDTPGLYSPSLYVLHVQALLSLGDVDAAVAVCEEGVSRFPQSPVPWATLAQMYQRTAVRGVAAKEKDAITVLQRGIAAVTEGAVSLWRSLLHGLRVRLMEEALTASDQSSDKRLGPIKETWREVKSWHKRCFDSLTPAVSEELRIAFADWAIAMLGVDGLLANLDVILSGSPTYNTFTKVLRRVLASTSVGGSAASEAKRQRTTAHNKDSQLADLHEAVVPTALTATTAAEFSVLEKRILLPMLEANECWIEYIATLKKYGKASSVPAAYSRAVKQLKDPKPFLDMYSIQMYGK